MENKEEYKEYNNQLQNLVGETIRSINIRTSGGWGWNDFDIVEITTDNFRVSLASGAGRDSFIDVDVDRV